MRSRKKWRNVLRASLCINVILAGWIISKSDEAPNLEPKPALITEPAVEQAPTNPTTNAPVRVVVADPHWNQISSVDLSEYRSRLEAIDCPNPVIGRILTAEIYWAYWPKLQELWGRSKGNFWEQIVHRKTKRKPTKTPLQEQAIDELKSLLEELHGQLKEYGGVQTGHDDRYSKRYPNRNFSSFRNGHLSQEVQLLLEKQEMEESERRKHIYSSGTPITPDTIEEGLRDLKAQHKAQREALLSPEDIEEYQLRHSKYFSAIRDLYGFVSSPEERKTVIELNEEYKWKVPEEKWAEVFDEKRLQEFKRAKDREFITLVKVANRMELPQSAAMESFRIKRLAEEAASQLRSQSPPEETAIALREIGKETEKEMINLLGEKGLELYRKNGGEWMRSFR